MGSGCRSLSCVVDAHRPVRRPTYGNLYKWPESDAEFVKAMTAGGGDRSPMDCSVGGGRTWSQSPSPRVVDSYSCRQMYLRSYVFSKEETAAGKARRCIGKAKERFIVLFPFLQRKASESRSMREEKKPARKSKLQVKEIAYSALFSIFYRFLLCTGTSTVEVVDHRS